MNLAPCCGREHESSTVVEGPDTPAKQNDLSICAHCGTWLTFDGSCFRPLTQDEIDGLAGNVRLKMQRLDDALETWRKKGLIR